MSSGYVRAGANANSGVRTSAYRITQQCGWIERVLRTAQSLWPQSTAAELSIKSGASVRTCERWVSERTGISTDALAELLRSDDGLKFLEAIMGDARPDWWRAFKRTMQLSELRQRQEQQRRLLEDLEREASN